MTEDAELLRDYAERGSEAAFADLVRRRLGLVYSVALRQTGGDIHLAEDVAQKVFTQMARKAGPLSRHPAVSAWLYRTTQFEAINLVRGERRRRRREQEAQIMETLTRTLPHGADDAALRAALDEAMGELNDRERAMVMLRFFEERPFAEIGRRLRVTEDAARMRTERVLEKMRTLLARRGITSTAAALSGVLANQAGAAMPAGLAASVTGAALAGASSTTSLGAATLLMSMTKFQIAVAASVVANVLLLGVLSYRAPEMIRQAEAADRLARGPVPGTERASAVLPGAASGSGLNLSAGEWQTLTSGDPKQLLARLTSAGVPADLARKATALEIFSRFIGRYREVYAMDDPMPGFWTGDPVLPLYLNGEPRFLAIDRFWREVTQAVEDALGPGALFETMIESEKNAAREQFGDLAPERMSQLIKAGWNFTAAQAEAQARANLGQATLQDQAVLAERAREQQARVEAILTPEERERNDLRNSGTAAVVRNGLVMLNPTEEEFRAAYAVRKAYEAEKGPEPAANATAARNAWNLELNNRVAAVLSPERAEEFRLKNLNTPEATQLARLVTRLELPFDNVERVMKIQQVTQQQAGGIRVDRTLTPAVKTQQLEALAGQATADITAALGGDPRVLEVFKLNGGTWLSTVPRLGTAATQ